MPVNPYENLTAVACLGTETARKRRYGQFAGSVDTSQAKCKLGLIEHFHGSSVFVFLFNPESLL